MARVTDDEVKEILQTTIDTEPFITAATLIVDYHLGTSALSAPLLKEIERWLAAHLACVRHPRWHELRDLETSVRVERGQAGKGLQSTSYGQQVVLLDPTGLLVAAMTTQRAWIRVD